MPLTPLTLRFFAALYRGFTVRGFDPTPLTPPYSQAAYTNQYYITTKLLYSSSVVLHRMPSDATISVSTEVRDELRSYKQGGITTYDEILRAMLDEVDPEELIGNE